MASTRAPQPHDQQTRPLNWSVPCLDATGRPRLLGIIDRRTGLALVTPPGECAYLDAEVLRRFIALLAQEAGHLVPSNALLRVNA
jgi:hypothetical protein